MFWWVTVPAPTSGSHIEMALEMSLPGIEVEVLLGVGRRSGPAG